MAKGFGNRKAHLRKPFSAPGAFVAVLEAAGFPSLGDLDVGGDLLGDGGDIHVAETVVEGWDVVRIADGGVVLPMRNSLIQVTQRGGVLAAVAAPTGIRSVTLITAFILILRSHRQMSVASTQAESSRHEMEKAIGHADYHMGITREHFRAVHAMAQWARALRHDPQNAASAWLPDYAEQRLRMKVDGDGRVVRLRSTATPVIPDHADKWLITWLE